MSYYLAAIKPCQLNTKLYDDKIRFWKGMVENYCEYKGSSRICVQELKYVFKRYGTTPCCIQDVISHMEYEGSVVDEDKFMQQPKSWFALALNVLIVKPIGMIVEMISDMKTRMRDEQIMFIVVSAVMNQSRHLISHIRDGIPAVLHYLRYVSKTVSIDAAASNSKPNQQMIKFFDTRQVLMPISDIERSIFSLDQTEKLLLYKIEQLDQLKEEVAGKARLHVREGNREMARNCLRKKLLMEADIAKRISILDNVQTMLHRVRSSMSDCEILAIYQTGIRTIKSIYDDHSMSSENIQKIVDEMHEIFEKQDDFETIISGAPYSFEDNNDDIELELESLHQSRNSNVDHLADETRNPLASSNDSECKKQLEDLQSLEVSLKKQNEKQFESN